MARPETLAMSLVVVFAIASAAARCQQPPRGEPVLDVEEASRERERAVERGGDSRHEGTASSGKESLMTDAATAATAYVRVKRERLPTPAERDSRTTRDERHLATMAAGARRARQENNAQRRAPTTDRREEERRNMNNNHRLHREMEDHWNGGRQ